MDKFMVFLEFEGYYPVSFTDCQTNADYENVNEAAEYCAERIYNMNCGRLSDVKVELNDRPVTSSDLSNGYKNFPVTGTLVTKVKAATPEAALSRAISMIDDKTYGDVLGCEVAKAYARCVERNKER